MAEKVTEEVASALANPLVKLLGKPAREFTRFDLLKAVRELNIERFTFRYTGLDGHLRELRLPFSDYATAERLLAMGERVDGSSLFHGIIDAAGSDLYVVPRYASAFINPFDSTSLDFICRFMRADGSLALFTPENILDLAAQRLKKKTGFELHALGELEFYLIAPAQNAETPYPIHQQGGYHVSTPFFKYSAVIDEMLHYIQQITGAVKYTHGEVGFIDCLQSADPRLDKHSACQFEVEMRTLPIEEMGDALALARWLIRTIALKHGMMATFAPKLDASAAGTGMHVHVELMKDGHNAMLGADGDLSEDALKLIGGLVRFAPSLTGFGNTVAASYLRLVPNHEAPTKICWSFSNRSSLVRVPLGWRQGAHLAAGINPQDTQAFADSRGQQTVELRSPDGSALTYALLAGMATAAEWGLSDPGSLELTRTTKVEGNIFVTGEADSMLSLPANCAESADILERERALYEQFGTFPPLLIDHMLKVLRHENDRGLSELLQTDPEQERKFNQEISDMTQRLAQISPDDSRYRFLEQDIQSRKLEHSHGLQLKALKAREIMHRDLDRH